MDALIQDRSVRPFNGVILITRWGETVYQASQGYADFETRTPILMSDKFRIQSNSKQITAVLVLKEVERGMIDLDAPLSAYLSDLNQDWGDQVTVHNLLNMTSGITGLEDDLKFEPGTDFYYSNPGYGLLGAILEEITGKSYSQLANNLFSELGMTDTFPFSFDGNNDVIFGHIGSPDNIIPLPFSDVGFTPESWKSFIPTGGIVSNAADLLLWDTKLHTGQLVSDASYEKMTRYSTTRTHAAYGSEVIGYGYGLNISDKAAKKNIGHAGRGIGFASLKFYVPEDDVSVIVLENVYLTDEPGDAAVIYHFEREIRNLVLQWLSE